MAGDLVNAFGKIALDETSRDISEILEDILIETRKVNLHLTKLTDENITEFDVIDDGDIK